MEYLGPPESWDLKNCKVKGEIVDFYKNISANCVDYYRLIIKDDLKYYKVGIAKYHDCFPNKKTSWNFSPKLGDYYYFKVNLSGNGKVGTVISYTKNKNEYSNYKEQVCTSNETIFTQKSGYDYYFYLIIAVLLILSILIGAYFFLNKKGK